MQTRYKSIVLILTAGLVFGPAHAFFTSAAALNNQTITFPANSNKTYGVAPFAVDRTASSGLAVSFAPLASPVCAVSGNTDTIVAAGTCTIQPSQSGNANYAAALNINQSFTAKQATLGMPTSADFFLKAYDPRKHDYAYATFKRLPDGRGIVFGGFGAVTTSNNAVTAYNPVTDTWETLLATQTFTIGPQLGDGTYDVRGKSFLGNRDNQFGLVHPMMMPVIARRQPARGASHGCFWAPGAYVSPGVFADQLILNGQGNGTTYGLRLNY